MRNASARAARLVTSKPSSSEKRRSAAWSDSSWKKSALACEPRRVRRLKNPGDFLAWFVELKESQLGQTDALFPWLAEHANQPQMCWFLSKNAPMRQALAISSRSPK